MKASRLAPGVILSLAVACARPLCAAAQTRLPGVTVTAPKVAAAPSRKRRVAAAPTRRPVNERIVARVAARPAPTAAARPAASAPAGSAPAAPAATSPAAVAAGFDASRERLFAPTGANVASLGKADVDAMPQGANQSLNQVLLQFPGVTQDSAASGGLHVRNEHAILQYRIDGIMLPDGVSGFASFMETSFVGKVALIDGALPAAYGLRTAGVVDVTPRRGAFDGGGAVGVYGGGFGAITSSLEYGGAADGWDWFVAGRLVRNRRGLENPAATYDAIHDVTTQGRGFAYLSKTLNPTTKLTFISGAYAGRFQIPNAAGQSPAFAAFGLDVYDSRALNETQAERNIFNVAAIQTAQGPVDAQVAAFSRSSMVRFVPDPIGDVLFNGNATDVFRSSVATGAQADAAWRVDPAHVLRFGLATTVERTRVVNSATLLPLDADGAPVDAPFGVVDRASRTGVVASGYVDHAWRLAEGLVVTTGLRFDQSWSDVTANQLSPRASLVWTPVGGTTLHAAYARYFTPPSQAVSAPVALALFANTTQQPEVALASPVRPERSNYFDVGVDHAIVPGLTVGVGAYHKRARNLLDDGQFGPAVVLTAFNYDRAYNTGVELKARYADATISLYANLAWARQRGTQVSSNQFLFGADELAAIASRYIHTDHAQTWTASAGGALRVAADTRLSARMVYGSGLRNGFVNTTSLSPYAQVDAGLAQEVRLPGLKPTTLRLDVINLFDHVYRLRDGSGIGVFAPQYGPRRGVYAGLSQRF